MIAPELIMPRSTRRRIVAEYMLARLREECSAERGVQASISRATGFSTSHISNVLNPDSLNPRGIGDDFIHAVSERWWKLSYAQVADLAADWQKVKKKQLQEKRAQEPAESPPPINDEQPDAIPARGRAIQRLEGVVEREVLDALRSTRPQENFDEADWIALALRLRDMSRMGVPISAPAPVEQPKPKRSR